MWSDTDPAGIVWFGVFCRYFEHAEEDLYRHLGSDRTALLRQLNVFMPRTSMKTGFRSPARLGDEIAVGIGISDDHRPPHWLRVRHPRARQRPADLRSLVPRRLRGRDDVRDARVSGGSRRAARRPRVARVHERPRPNDERRSPPKRWAFRQSSTPPRISSIATSPKGAAPASRSSAATRASPTTRSSPSVSTAAATRCARIGVRPEDRVVAAASRRPRRSSTASSARSRSARCRCRSTRCGSRPTIST